MANRSRNPFETNSNSMDYDFRISFIGAIIPFPFKTAPMGFLKCDGSAVSRTTYARLFAFIAPPLGTVTMTIASPCVVTKTAHGLLTGDAIYLTTTGALPTGLTANTLYYAIKIDADTFNLATSRANADAGTKINTSGTQSGTHTAVECPHGLGDGSTTFNVPDLRELTLVMQGASVEFNNLGETGGEKTHTLITSEMPSHTHNVSYQATQAGTGAFVSTLSGAGNTATSSAGSGAAHNNLQPYGIVNYFIKT